VGGRDASGDSPTCSWPAPGAQLETIQRHLGHQDVATTMIYLHVPQKRQDDEISKAFA
jgi:site-specific recombinase XerD